IKAAEDAVALGAKIRDAADIRKKIEAKRAEASEAAAEAVGLRDAAKRTLSLLVDPINELQCGIEIDEHMRLIYTDHPTRGQWPVEDLSPGGACALVIRLISRIVGSDVDTFVSIPQEDLEGLDPINLRMLIEEVANNR